MADLNVRSDAVDVEQIMKQIRSRIREKRGADYTDAELQKLASVKLEQFADPSGLRSDLLVQFQQKGNEPSTYHRHRGPRRWLLMLLHPLLKRIQKQMMSDLNLYFEIIHNLVIEVTRLGIDNNNLKMRVESLSSRLEFDERRGRALEQVVQYRSDALPRHRPHDGQRQHQAQQGQGQPSQPAQTQQQTSGTVSYGAPAASGPPAASSSAPAAASAEGGQRPNDQGQGQRPDGSRRRRRRRRRRPGHSMAQGQSGDGNAGPGNNGGQAGSFAPAASHAEPSDDHDDGPGGDGEDDGSDQ
jgi:hypothetical protein